MIVTTWVDLKWRRRRVGGTRSGRCVHSMRWCHICNALAVRLTVVRVRRRQVVMSWIGGSTCLQVTAMVFHHEHVVGRVLGGQVHFVDEHGLLDVNVIGIGRRVDQMRTGCGGIWVQRQQHRFVVVQCILTQIRHWLVLGPVVRIVGQPTFREQTIAVAVHLYGHGFCKQVPSLVWVWFSLYFTQNFHILACS